MLSDACEKCGLWYGCRSPGIATETPVTKGPVDILYVGDFPDGDDDTFGKPFVGASGKWFRRFLAAGDCRVALANAVRCRLPYDQKVKKFQIEACATHLKADIEQLNPKIIVVMGASAYEAVTGKKGSISKLTTRPQKLGERWLLTTYHPSNHPQRRDLTGDFTYLATTINSILETGRPQGEVDPDIRIVSRDNVGDALRQIGQAPLQALDAEWNTTKKEQDENRSTVYMPGRRVLCLGVATDPAQPVWVCPPEFLETLRPYLMGRTLVFHNAPSDVTALVWCLGWHELLQQKFEDTFMFHASRDRGYIGNGLQDLAIKYLQVPAWKQIAGDAIEAERKRRLSEGNSLYPTLEDIPFQTMAQYNGRDALYTLKLHQWFQRQGWQPSRSYHWLRIPSIKLLSSISLRGIGINEDALEVAIGKTIRKDRELLQTLRRAPEIRWIERTRGEPFNPRSTPHMQELVRATGVTVPLTKTGKPSTKKEVLVELAQDSPLWRRVMRTRSFENLLSKFLFPMRLHRRARDGRVHPTYHAAKMTSDEDAGEDSSGGAVSRLSCAAPPMQQVKKDPALRVIIVPRHGKWLVEIDYSGAEPRVQAVLAGCRKLISWFKRGIDPYIELTNMVWNIARDEVTKDQRQESKAGFLARMYGQGVRGFSARQKCSPERTQVFFDFFDRNFREIPEMHRKLVKAVERGEMINTPWDSPRRFGRDYRFNQLVNDPVQSTSSELLLYKAIETNERWSEEEFAIVNLVHDSMQAEISQENTIEILTETANIMTRTDNLPFDFPFTCPLDVGIAIGNTLGDNGGKMWPWKPGEPLPAGLIRAARQTRS